MSTSILIGPRAGIVALTLPTCISLPDTIQQPSRWLFLSGMEMWWITRMTPATIRYHPSCRDVSLTSWIMTVVAQYVQLLACLPAASAEL